MRRAIWLPVALLSLAALGDRPLVAPVLFARQIAPVGPSAQWVPDDGVVSVARQACQGQSAASRLACMVDQFSRRGAPADALAFSQRLYTANGGELGFMRTFRDGGRVSVAYVVYPPRTDAPDRDGAREACFLVNGSPDLIDVDDRDVLPLQRLNRDPVYRALQARYADLLIAPDRRDDASGPESSRVVGGGQRFTVSYRVLDGCQSCRLVGRARFAFDFDPEGRFTGARLVSVTDRVASATTSTRIGAAAINPARTFNVQVGETFTVTLDANGSGASWRLTRALDAAVVTLVDDTVQKTDGTRTGRDTRNVWVFKAVGEGTTEVPLEYADDRGRVSRRMTFTIVVR